MSQLEIPQYTPEAILILCLSRPTSEHAHESLVTLIQDALSDPDQESDHKAHIVECKNSKRQIRLEQKRKDASMAELFTAASKAREKGWSQLGVVDNLTYRQIAGQLRHDEPENPSLVIVQLPPLSARQRHPLFSNQVLAKRFKLDEALNILVREYSFGVTPWQDYNDRWMEKRIFDEYGILLLDPEQPLFQPNFGATGPRDQQSHAVYQVCTQKPPLPLEVADMILDLVDEETPLQDMTEAPTFLKTNMEVLEVHALVPLSDVDALTKSLNAKLPEGEMKAVVYPWKGEVPATRREFWRLWDRIIDENRRPFYFAACFIDSATAIEDDALTVAIWHYNNPAAVQRISVKNVVPLWQKYFNRKYMTQGEYDLPHEAVKDMEILFDPDHRFFDDPPLWKDIGGGSKPPVFFLTKKPDQATLEQLKDRMAHNLGDYTNFEEQDGHPYNFVDWEREDDGDEQDMVRIATACNEYRGGRLGYSYPLFVDQQSLQDGTVILCRYDQVCKEDDDYENNDDNYASTLTDDYTEGIRYVRTPMDQVNIEWINLDIANVGWDELYGEGNAGTWKERVWESEEQRQSAKSKYKKIQRSYSGIE